MTKLYTIKNRGLKLISNKNIKKIKVGILLGCLFYFIISSIPLSNISNKTEVQSKVKISLDPIHDLTGTTIYIDNTNTSNDWDAFQATYAWCTGDGSALDPYTISQVLIDGPSTELITIKNSDVHFSITWCDLLGGYCGIYLDNVTNGEMLYNKITKNTLTYSSTGIRLYDCEDNFISENIIQNYPHSIYIKRVNNITIINNEFTTQNHNTENIFLMSSTNITFSKNSISGAASILFLFGTTNSMFIENELSRTSFFLKYDSNYNSFIGNVLLDSATAFYFYSSSYNEVINNSMYRATECFRETEVCIGNVFEGNYCQEGIILPPLEIFGALIGSIAVAGVTVFMYLKRRKYIRK